VANDPFHQHITDETINNSDIWQITPAINGRHENIKQISHTNHHSHYLGLTATYTFGGKKVRHIRHDLNNSESKRAEKQ